jgi:hypothetical protein
MQTIINNGLLNKARVMASKAKDGQMEFRDEIYNFTFDQNAWTYAVTDSQGDLIGNFNFKSLNEAKKYLQFYLSN